MTYIYILLLSNNQLYTGVTQDLKRRVAEHRNGKVHSTEQRRPLKLIHYESYLLKTDALRREKFLKTTEGKRLLRQQIKDVLASENIDKIEHYGEVAERSKAAGC
jgi:putative endonuclease